MSRKTTSNKEAALNSPGLSRRSFLGLSAAAAAGLTAVSVPAARAQGLGNTTTFVFIHGSWHGAWCFQFVANELISNGFRLVVRDLPGFGLTAQFPSSYLAGNLNPNELSPLASSTLDDYVNSVAPTILELRQAFRGPLIVVGHSLAGITLNELGERLGREVIDHLVYLTAFMTPAGQTANDVANLQIQDGTLLGTVLVGDSNVSGALRLNPNSTDPTYQTNAKNTFYNDVPAQMIPAIFNLLTPDQPLQPKSVTTSITRERWGRVPRTFIRCTLDQCIPIATQDTLIQAADAFTPGNPTQVVSLQSSHSPFFSMPAQLAAVLRQAARAAEKGH